MESAYQTILAERRDSIAWLVLNRPDKRNPIGPATCGELCHALAAAAADDTVRVVVLTGAGSVFSAGGDLGQMAGGSGAQVAIPPASFVDLLSGIHKVGKPVVAMVNGHALAGGMGLMVACDVVLASDQATFGTTEINLGLWPMMITAELVRNIGRKRALDLMLSGRRIDAVEAERIGLVTKVVPAAALETETMAYAQGLAAKSPAAMRLGLSAFYATQDMDFGAALPYLEGELGKVLALEDAAEGISAFLQKRPPVWKGR